MAEEYDDNKIASEDMEPGNGVVMESTEAPAEEARININDQSNSKSDIGAEGNADTEADKTTDSVKEDAGRRNSDIPVMGKSPASQGIDSAEGLLKKNSAAFIVGQNHKFTVRSRYRHASSGSCHDFCKYGHKHETEKKTKRPLMGTLRETRPLTRTASGDNIKNSVLDKETKNKPLLRRLSLPGVISTKDPTTISADKHSSKAVTPTRSKMKHVQSEIKPSSVVTPGKSISRIKIDIPDVMKTSVRSTNSPEKLTQKVKGMKTKEEAASNKKCEKENVKEPMINSPRTALKKSPSIKAVLVKNLKSFSRSRRDDSKINRSSDVPETKVKMAEPNNNKRASKFSVYSEKAPSIRGGSRVAKTKRVEGENTSPREGETSKKSGSTKRNGTVREDGGASTTTPRSKAAVNQKVKANRTGSSRPEEKEGSAWKVIFKRGTVLNLQVASSSPKKLQFKRGRVLAEDQSSKAEAVKSLKSKDDIVDGSLDDKPEHEKVRLRRQEAAAKKDNVDLNNVIEETASKLVKTRKSKVKALVGAFETVMSFRDRKPLVETSAS